jgi:hypothetical protein
MVIYQPSQDNSEKIKLLLKSRSNYSWDYTQEDGILNELGVVQDIIPLVILTPRIFLAIISTSNF